MSLLLLLPGVTDAAAQAFIAPSREVDPDGRPRPEWLEALRAFERSASPAGLREAVARAHPFTAEEVAWAELIEERARTAWGSRSADLGAPFGSTRPPDTVFVLVGNVGGEDAFNPSPNVIAFDVARLLEIYGGADEAENVDRIDRFFDHEYTHVLHKAWLRDHPVDLSTPLRRALWEALVEGIGTYRSLSGRWKDPGGGMSAQGRRALDRLEPVFVERMSALAYGDPALERDLRAGLSMGPFMEKWGALTVALWLLQETREGEGALANWVALGPSGILGLARLHLAPDEAAHLPRSLP